MLLSCQEMQNNELHGSSEFGTTKFTKINDMMTNQKELQIELRIASIFL